MRKETRDVATAFKAGRPLIRARSSTDGSAVYLHGHKIVERVGGPGDNNVLRLTLADWPTNTTRDRLNGVCEVFFGTRPFGQRNHKQFFEGATLGDRDVITYDGNSFSVQVNAYEA